MVFTTSLGAIAGAPLTSPQRLEVAIDSAVRAVAELISPTIIGQATIEASIEGVAGSIQRATVDFGPKRP